MLTRGPLADAVVAAIRDRHPALRIVDRGAYLRLLVPGRCLLERARVEQHLRAPFRLPMDLEAIMPSFRGRLTLTEEEALWEAGP